MASAATPDQATATRARQQAPLVKLSPPKLPLDVVHLILQQGSAVERDVYGHALDEREEHSRVAFLCSAALVCSEWVASALGLLWQYVDLKEPRKALRFMMGRLHHRTVSLRLGLEGSTINVEVEQLAGEVAELVLIKCTSLRHLTLRNISRMCPMALALPALARLETLVVRSSATFRTLPPSHALPLPFRLSYLIFQGPDEDFGLRMGEEWTEIHLRLFGALLHCVDGSALLYFEKRPSHPFIWHGVHLSLKSLQIISNHPWHWPPLLLPLLRQCHALEALRIVDFDEALLRALPNPLRELYIDDMCTIDELDLLWLVDEGCPSVSNLWVLGYMEGLEFGGAPPLLEEAIEEGGGVVESYERRELGAKAFLNHSYYGALASR